MSSTEEEEAVPAEKFVDEEAAATASSSDMLKPMPISSSTAAAAGETTGDGNSWGEWMFNRDETKRIILPRRYKLITDGNYRKHSIWTLQFAILTSAISTKMVCIVHSRTSFINASSKSSSHYAILRFFYHHIFFHLQLNPNYGAYRSQSRFIH